MTILILEEEKLCAAQDSWLNNEKCLSALLMLNIWDMHSTWVLNCMEFLTK